MTFDSEALAGNAEFLQRLAHQLIPDRHAAEDASQRVALAYLRGRPTGLRSTRAWMLGALRKERLKWFERRQRGGPGDDVPEQVGERRPLDDGPATKEVCELIERETRALREPYRSVLLAILFEDEPASEIARKLGRSQSTIRSQHKRGLELLRDRLDRRRGGREGWVRVLLPWAVVRAPPPEGGASVAATESRWAATWLLPLLVVAGAVVLVLRPWSARPDQRSEPMAAASPDEPRPIDPTDSGAGIADPADAAAVARSSVLAPENEAAPQIVPEWPARRMRVHVMDEFGNGVAKASILARSFPAWRASNYDLSTAEQVLREIAVTDASGRASVVFAPEFVGGAVWGEIISEMEVRAPGFASSGHFGVQWPMDELLDESLPETRVVLSGGAFEVTFRILGEGGDACTPAELYLSPVDEEASPAMSGIVRRLDRGAHVTDDGTGTLRLSDICKGAYQVFAWAPGRGISDHRIQVSEAGHVDLPLRDSHVVRGLVLDPRGQPVPGARVKFEAATLVAQLDQWTTGISDEDGAYGFVLGEVNRVSLTARHPTDESMQVTLTLNVAAGTTDSVDLQFTDEPMVSIRVVDSEGRPLARWLVTVLGGGDFLPKLEQSTDMFGRVQFARFPESGATVTVSEADVPGPLAPLVIHSFRPASGENVLVVENAHAEPSAVLGLVSTPGWTAAESIGIEIRQPGVRGIGTLRLGVVYEPFALEPVSAGTADLSLRMGPTLLHHLGVWELPAGGFCDLGHIEVPAPGRVRFAREAESSNEGEAAEYWILLPVSTPVDSVKQPVARLPGLPEDHVDLLPGSYMLFYVDRQGVEHSISFDVRSRESGVVTVPSSP